MGHKRSENHTHDSGLCDRYHGQWVGQKLGGFEALGRRGKGILPLGWVHVMHLFFTDGQFPLLLQGMERKP